MKKIFDVLLYSIAQISVYGLEYLSYRVTHKGCDFSDDKKLFKSNEFE